MCVCVCVCVWGGGGGGGVHKLKIIQTESCFLEQSHFYYKPYSRDHNRVMYNGV